MQSMFLWSRFSNRSKEKILYTILKSCKVDFPIILLQISRVTTVWNYSWFLTFRILSFVSYCSAVVMWPDLKLTLLSSNGRHSHYMRSERHRRQVSWRETFMNEDERTNEVWWMVILLFGGGKWLHDPAVSIPNP